MNASRALTRHPHLYDNAQRAHTEGFVIRIRAEHSGVTVRVAPDRWLDIDQGHRTWKMSSGRLDRGVARSRGTRVVPPKRSRL